MSSDSAATHLLIYAPAALHREAWRALLADQPSIVIGGMLTDAVHLADHPQTDRPTTLLIDLPALQPDVIKPLKDSRPALGLLVLAYDLAEIIPLLKAGATGCVSRDETVSNLARGVIAAGRGELVLPPSIATQALLALARGEPLESGPICCASTSRPISGSAATLPISPRNIVKRCCRSLIKPIWSSCRSGKRGLWKSRRLRAGVDVPLPYSGVG